MIDLFKACMAVIFLVIVMVIIVFIAGWLAHIATDAFDIGWDLWADLG